MAQHTTTARKPRRIKSEAEKLAAVRAKAAKLYYADGKRVVIGGVPCRINGKAPRNGYSEEAKGLNKFSREQVMQKERNWCREQLSAHGYEIGNDPVAAWMTAYPEIRALRGDVIPVFEDNSMDVDMFTGEETVPEGFETPAPVETAETIAETPASDRQDADGLWIVDMGQRPARASAFIAPPANMIADPAYDEWGCERMVHCIPIRESSEILETAPAPADAVAEDAPETQGCQIRFEITEAELRAYWRDCMIKISGRSDAGWEDAMHDMWAGRSLEELRAAQEAAARAGDDAGAWMAAGYVLRAQAGVQRGNEGAEWRRMA